MNGWKLEWITGTKILSTRSPSCYCATSGTSGTGANWMGNGTFILSSARCLIACIYLAKNENKYHIKGPGKSCFKAKPYGREKKYKAGCFPSIREEKNAKHLPNFWKIGHTSGAQRRSRRYTKMKRKRECVCLTRQFYCYTTFLFQLETIAANHVVSACGLYGWLEEHLQHSLCFRYHVNLRQMVTLVVRGQQSCCSWGFAFKVCAKELC